MSFEAELRRYLERGIDLQHRRIEYHRYLKDGSPYQQCVEERVKWRQDVRYNVRPDSPMRPAIWEIVPVYF